MLAFSALALTFTKKRGAFSFLFFRSASRSIVQTLNAREATLLFNGRALHQHRRSEEGAIFTPALSLYQQLVWQLVPPEFSPPLACLDSHLYYPFMMVILAQLLPLPLPLTYCL